MKMKIILFKEKGENDKMSSSNYKYSMDLLQMVRQPNENNFVLKKEEKRGKSDKLSSSNYKHSMDLLQMGRQPNENEKKKTEKMKIK